MSSTTIKTPEIVKTIQLAHPIQLGSESITELKFQRLKAKHLRGLPPFVTTDEGKTEFGFDFLLILASRLCAEHSAVIDELEGEDIFEVVGVVGDFFGDSPLTLKMPSAT